MKCSVKGCDKPSEKRTWCAMHYRRWQRHGNPLTNKRPNIGKGCTYKNIQGYIVFQIGKKSILIHRKIMEEFIGRKLKSEEFVHHINGIKDDNRINNLQVVSPGEHMVIHYKGKFRNPLNSKTHKVCPRCHIRKKLSLFYKDKHNSNGHRAHCISCCSIIFKENYKHKI